MIELLVTSNFVRLSTQIVIQRIRTWKNSGVATTTHTQPSTTRTIMMALLHDQRRVRRLFNRYADVVVSEISKHPSQRELVTTFLRELALPHLEPRSMHQSSDPVLAALRTDIERCGGIALVAFYHELVSDLLALL